MYVSIIYIYMYIHIYIHIHTYTYVCAYIYIYIKQAEVDRLLHMAANPNCQDPTGPDRL